MKRLILAIAVTLGLAGSPATYADIDTAETDSSIWRLFEGSRLSDQITDKLNTEVTRAAVSLTAQVVTDLFKDVGRKDVGRKDAGQADADNTSVG